VAHPQIAAFARLANGNAKALRAISGQNSLLSRDVHDMGYDSIRDEIVVTQPRMLAIMTYKADANGDVPPIRKIMGPKTQIRGAGRVTLDSVNHELYIPGGDKVLVFPQDGDGDVAPIRVLEGPDTRLGAMAVAVDPVHNLLFVSGRSPGWGPGLSTADLFLKDTEGLRGSLEGGSVGQIAIFDRTASGNTKPLRVITGSKTLLSSGYELLMTTYPPRGLIFVAVGGSDYGESGGAPASTKSFLGVWSIFDQGDVPPRWTVGGPNGVLRRARGVTLDPKHKTVLVSDKFLNAVLSFEFPEVF
jgi:hypothetical protein